MCERFDVLEIDALMSMAVPYTPIVHWLSVTPLDHEFLIGFRFVVAYLEILRFLDYGFFVDWGVGLAGERELVHEHWGGGIAGRGWGKGFLRAGDRFDEFEIR